MKARVRFNKNADSWECKFEENGNWYLIGKRQNHDVVWDLKYRVLKYKVNRIMKTFEICDFDIYPFASNLKEELGFDKDVHNSHATVVYKQLQAEQKAAEELKKQEDEKKRLAEKAERDKKRRNNNNKFNKTNNNKVLAANAKFDATDFELKVRADIENGMFKKQIKKKYNISNEEYRKYKNRADLSKKPF
jgi:hypothetical protein